MLFEGSATALVTPFDGDRVDFEAYGEQIDYQVNNGTSALVVLGTTGEPATMTSNEKTEVIKFAIKHINKRVPCIVGTFTNSTASSIDASVEACKLGADALLGVTPYYNKCTQKGLVAHYEAIAAKVDKPIIVYNVPSRTGINIAPTTYQELAKIPNIDSIKEASGNIDQISESARLTEGKLTLYSGDDGIIVPLMALGGKGIISVMSNLLPKEVAAIAKLCLEGKYLEARQMQWKYAELIKLLFCEVNPIPIKAAMNLANMKAGSLRLPLTTMEDMNQSKLKQEMIKLHIIKA